MKQYVLITGITGELGAALAEVLVELKIPTACIIRKDKSEYDLDLGPFKVLKTDITDRENLFKYVNELKGKVHAVAHMASARRDKTEKELRETIVDGTLHLYDFAKEIGCPKFLYFSSTFAAGSVPREVPYIDETFMPNKKRLSCFGKMKLAAEEKLLSLSKVNITKVIILRAGNIYGPPTKLSFIKAVVDIIKNREKVLYHRARRSVIWSPIYVQDAIELILKLLLEEKEFNNQVYFLTGSEVVTLDLLVKILLDEMHIPAKAMELGFRGKCDFAFKKFVDLFRCFIDSPSFPNSIYSNNKLKNDFGFMPKTGVREGVPYTYKWALAKGAI